MKYDRRIVPSIFTMLNLFFGFFAIVNALKGQYVPASFLIILAAVWDGMDGKIARLTNTSSEFGIQFDSITDVVSFGVAPSILMYCVFPEKMYLEKLDAVSVIISFFPLLFGAIRLARFNVNVEGFEKENFTGLPIPAMAVTLSSFVIFTYIPHEGLKFAHALIPLVLFLSYLMVSNVEYEALPKFTFKYGKRNTISLVMLLTGLSVMLVLGEKAIFPLIFGFVLYGFLKSMLSHRGDREDDEVFDVSISD